MCFTLFILLEIFCSLQFKLKACDRSLTSWKQQHATCAAQTWPDWSNSLKIPRRWNQKQKTSESGPNRCPAPGHFLWQPTGASGSPPDLCTLNLWACFSWQTHYVLLLLLQLWSIDCRNTQPFITVLTPPLPPLPPLLAASSGSTLQHFIQTGRACTHNTLKQ